ncbi:MAG: FAD-binding protein [Sedimentisphaerales bacterium]|nr:FAD-binding protein [Sedimentisphaerales bacterium]
MSHYIVLVKQVPDVSQITDNAFDPETGTLMRGKLASVINELDAEALAFAGRMRSLDNDSNSKIIALTMGPPMAAEVLRYSLARLADTAVLLTDRALGGADTVATANPLAYAVRKICRDLLGGSEDYFVVSGMQSVDGDTAQVPAQLAEELGIPCVAYATDVVRENGRLEFTRIIAGGSQLVAPKRTPAVITVAKYEHTLYPTVARTRWANRCEVITWGANDINASWIGVKGSKTSVIRVFPPPKTSRKCQAIAFTADFARLIADSFKGNGQVSAEAAADKGYVLPARRRDALDRNYEGTDKQCQAFEHVAEELRKLGVNGTDAITDEIKTKLLEQADGKFTAASLNAMLEGFAKTTPSYQGEVWVVAEHHQEAVHAATYELIGKARDLADSLKTNVGVVIAGKHVRPYANSLIAAGADKVYVIEDDRLEEFDPAAYRKVIAATIDKHSPQIVLYAATPQGRVLAPMVSYRLQCGLTADCTGLDIRDNSRKGEIAILMQTRPALGGNVMATICTKDSRCQMATARPGVMKRLPAVPDRRGEVIAEPAELTGNDFSLDIIQTELGAGKVNFDADVIVSGGRGMLSKENYTSLISQMCQAIQSNLGVTVERGASRAAVEEGFSDRVHQVGQTGTAVGPKLYFALGISGAIQHMIGVANAGTIFAVNADPHAPIFKQCDYYLVGNVEDIVPELTQQLQASN